MTSFKTKNSHIELKIVGYDEPNNGRELHIAELYINQINCTNNYFNGLWNRLNYHLEKFMFESPDCKYVFIPAEGVSFLINTTTLNFKALPYKGISTLQFQKNEFIGNQLIVYYDDETIKIDLDDF